MPREPVLSLAADRDEAFDSGLRPTRIKDMVGQRDVIERLNIVVDAARKRANRGGIFCSTSRWVPLLASST